MSIPAFTVSNYAAMPPNALQGYFASRCDPVQIGGAGDFLGITTEFEIPASFVFVLREIRCLNVNWHCLTVPPYPNPGFAADNYFLTNIDGSINPESSIYRNFRLSISVNGMGSIYNQIPLIAGARDYIVPVYLPIDPTSTVRITLEQDADAASEPNQYDQEFTVDGITGQIMPYIRAYGDLLLDSGLPPSDQPLNTDAIPVKL